jgi:hypothetical protein
MTGYTLGCDALVRHLRQGDFSLLAPAFAPAGSDEPRVLQVLRSGCFDAHPDELAEALTCAAFLGALSALEHLLRLGVPPEGGAATGLNALPWAANRGELGAVRRLLAAGAALEARNSFGGTVLGATVWASVHEPRDAHAAIVAELLTAGADVREAGYPSGHADIDALLEQAGARA